MALTPEELELRLRKLQDKVTNLESQVQGDYRIPTLATGFDLESSIFSPAVRVRNDAAITIGTGASGLALTFNTELFDTDGMHSTTTNSGRLTAKVEGIYLVTANVRWDRVAGGRRELDIRFGGVTVIALAEIGSLADGAAFPAQFVAALYKFEIDDYVDVVVRHTQGGDVDIRSEANLTPEFGMVWVAPLTQ